MKRLSVFLIVLLLCFSAFAAYNIENAGVQVSVGKNAVHSVREDYIFNFQTAQHGFYRYIRTDYSYLENPVHAGLSDIACSDYCSVSNEEGWAILKIGSSSKTYEGMKNFSLSYSYDLGADHNEGYDEFYFNLWGSDWEVPTRKFNFSVFVPLEESDFSVWVTRGQYGSSDSTSYSLKSVEGGTLIEGYCLNLEAGEAVTIRVELPEGFYTGAREPWDYRQIMHSVALAVCSVIVVLAAVIWLFNGKDYVPIISAKFDPPQGMNPLAVGYLVDGSVDDRDITSMLFYWADKGLIEIEEPKKDKFVFVKKADLPFDTPKAEQTLFYGLFICSSTDSVSLNQLQEGNYFSKIEKAKVEQVMYFRKQRALFSIKNKFLSVLFTVLSFFPPVMLALATGLYEFAPDDVFAIVSIGFIYTIVLNFMFAGFFRKFYVRKSNSLFAFFIILFSLLYLFICSSVAVSISSVSYVFAVYCLFCGVMTSLFARIMPKRSDYGRKLFEDVLGYREFIEKVSMSELILMIDKDPQYYYHVLCYAITLGLEDKWAKKFEVVNTPAPTWYRGITPMDIHFHSALSRRMRSAVKASAIPPQVKNSGHTGGVGGGFHMSGFSGGGFGGGGGRAW